MYKFLCGHAVLFLVSLYLEAESLGYTAAPCVTDEAHFCSEAGRQWQGGGGQTSLPSVPAPPIRKLGAPGYEPGHPRACLCSSVSWGTGADCYPFAGAFCGYSPAHGGWGCSLNTDPPLWAEKGSGGQDGKRHRDPHAPCHPAVPCNLPPNPSGPGPGLCRSVPCTRLLSPAPPVCGPGLLAGDICGVGGRGAGAGGEPSALPEAHDEARA